MDTAFYDAESELEPSLKNIINQPSLKWIFVGGKGGVGKTTVSCSLAILLAQVRETVLIISTDPAHNLSDAFNQKFTKTPTVVNGYPNLFAIEIDPTSAFNEVVPEEMFDEISNNINFEPGYIKEFLGSLPGVDEAMSYNEVLKLVSGMEFSTVVLDTAPTGHTLRLLSFPNLFEKCIKKILKFRNRIDRFVNRLNFPGMATTAFENYAGKMEELLTAINQLNAQFKNPEQTTFVCVCMAEFLSVYETERLIQQIFKFGIDTHNIVVNQLFPDTSNCSQCTARLGIQNTYLEQIADLYVDFHITKLPRMDCELRGAEQLVAFSKKLIGES